MPCSRWMRAAPSFGPALLEEEGQEERFHSIEVGTVRSLFPHPSPGSSCSVLDDVIFFMDVLICFMALEICLQVNIFKSSIIWPVTPFMTWPLKKQRLTDFLED